MPCSRQLATTGRSPNAWVITILQLATPLASFLLIVIPEITIKAIDTMQWSSFICPYLIMTSDFLR
jgi:hypothetical protein